jgi:DNA-binding winged helix-turn-helix (wHTH) protein
MHDRVFRFANHHVDPASRELWRGDRLVPLPPHVFDCLAYLIERSDRAVGRDELVAAVWGKTEVSDTLLGQTILRIRRELGDDAKEQRMLRTIPRFGYRWIAPLRTSDPAGPGAVVVESAQPIPPAEGVVHAAPAASPAAARTRLAIGALLLAALLVVGVEAIRHYTSTPQTGPAVHAGLTLATAVLPAQVEPGAEWGWMRLAVMDVVASRLRSSGLPSVPSEDIVALLKAPQANRDGTIREATRANLLVAPQVHRVDAFWRVELNADDGAGQHFAVEAQAKDVTVAAREAADKLLVAFGQQPADDGAEAATYSSLIKRVDAAILADDPDTARALIDRASDEEKHSPELRLRLAKIDFRGGRLVAAHDRLIALLDEAPAKTAPVLRASILNGLGAVAIRSDQPQEAEQVFGEAIDLLASRSDPAQLGQAYLGRAAAAADQHHFEAAAADYARARIALRQANDTLALIRVAANEGFLDMDQDRPAQALPQFVAATEGFRQWGALNEAIFTYIGQISCHLALLNGPAAMQAADAAAALAQRIDNPATLASFTLARARALAAVGRLREARDALDRLRSTTSDAIAAAVADAILARIELDANNAAAAGDLAEHAVATLTAPSYAGVRADAWLTQIRAAQRGADAVRSDAAIAALEDWASRNDERGALVYAHLARAEHALKFGSDKAWRDDFDAARQLAERGAVPLEIAAVARSYADALIADGDLTAAAVEVGRVSRWSEQDFTCAVLEARLYAALGRDEARQTAVARARALAGERLIPSGALATPISTRSAATH